MTIPGALALSGLVFAVLAVITSVAAIVRNDQRYPYYDCRDAAPIRRVAWVVTFISAALFLAAIWTEVAA